MSRGTIRFSIGPVPVEVSPSFWILAALLGMAWPLEILWVWLVVVFFSVLVHEFGHAGAMLAFGAQPRIMLQGLGGLTAGSLPERVAHPRLASMAIALAGPFAGFALGGLSFVLVRYLGHSNDTLSIGLRMLMVVNIAWGVVNLLPVLPLDGGNLMRAILLGRDPASGLRRALWISIVLSPVLALVFWQMDWSWAAFLFALFAYQAVVQLLKLRREVADMSLGLAEKYDQATQALLDKRWPESRELAVYVVEHAKNADLKTAAAQIGAYALLMEHQPQEALSLLHRVPNNAIPPLIHGVVLLEAGRAEQSVAYLRSAMESEEYQKHQRREAGSYLVRALREIGNHDEADRIELELSKET